MAWHDGSMEHFDKSPQKQASAGLLDVCNVGFIVENQRNFRQLEITDIIFTKRINAMRFLKRLLGNTSNAPRVTPSTTRRKVVPPNPTINDALEDEVIYTATSPFHGTYSFIALDVETANSDAGSICQIGIACVQNDGTIQTYKDLVNPLCYFDDFNVGIHGITAKMVSSAPPFSRIIKPYLGLMTTHKIIQHSQFDKRAFQAAFDANAMPFPDMQWHDSVIIARRAWPEFIGNGGHGLANLKKRLNLEFTHHDAEEDAKAAAMIVLAAMKKTNQTIEELTKPKPRQSYPKSVSKTADINGKLFGAVACFTGKISMSREDAATLAAKAGMEVKAGVTRKTTVLIVGDQDLHLLAGHKKSSKHRKAEAMIEQGFEIEIIAETEFLRLLERAGES